MNKLLRKLLYGCELLRCVGRMPRPAEVPIDVLMPVCEKDLEILPLALEGVRRQVSHPIAAIYIVAAPSPVVEAFCRAHDCRFVDERSVLGYDAASLGVKIPPRTAGTAAAGSSSSCSNSRGASAKATFS